MSVWYCFFYARNSHFLRLRHQALFFCVRLIKLPMNLRSTSVFLKIDRNFANRGFILSGTSTSNWKQWEPNSFAFLISCRSWYSANGRPFGNFSSLSVLWNYCFFCTVSTTHTPTFLWDWILYVFCIITSQLIHLVFSSWDRVEYLVHWERHAFPHQGKSDESIP